VAAEAPVSVQLFGLRDSRPTQRALRFFRERRVPVTFVDLARRPLARGELSRFIQKFGARELLDTSGRPYRDAGLAWLSLDDDALGERLLAVPGLLRLPLARSGSRLSVGADEAAWRAWLARP
jgi:arsenate reductase (glutaredoxin)